MTCSHAFVACINVMPPGTLFSSLESWHVHHVSLSLSPYFCNCVVPMSLSYVCGIRLYCIRIVWWALLRFPKGGRKELCLTCIAIMSSRYVAESYIWTLAALFVQQVPSLLSSGLMLYCYLRRKPSTRAHAKARWKKEWGTNEKYLPYYPGRVFNLHPLPPFPLNAFDASDRSTWDTTDS